MQQMVRAKDVAKHRNHLRTFKRSGDHVKGVMLLRIARSNRSPAAVEPQRLFNVTFFCVIKI